MKSQNELIANIRLTTSKIQEKYPELIKYMKVIPGDLSLDTNKELTSITLKDYLDSLNSLLETYAKEH